MLNIHTIYNQVINIAFISDLLYNISVNVCTYPEKGVRNLIKEAVGTIRKYLSSVYFIDTVFVLACIVTATGQEVAGMLVFAVIIMLVLIFTDDILATTPVFLLLSAFEIKSFGSYNTYIKFWWLVFPVAFSVVFHIVKYKRKIAWGSNIYGILAATAAVTLGGLGKITFKEYFSGVSLYYTAALGIGMIIVYIAAAAYIRSDDKENLSERFSVMMSTLCLFCCFMVMQHYVVHWDKVMATQKILDFQWRNNVSTLVMISLPFPFYLSRKNSLNMIPGFLGFLTMLVSGSRGGLIFGTVEFMLCLLMTIFFDRKHRKLNVSVFAGLLLVFVMLSSDLFSFISKTLKRLFEYSENRIRLGLLERAVKDFESNPLFGRGLGYFGNRDIHKSAKFSLCWYHSSPFQIIGSFGLFGVACYVFQYFIRIRTVVQNIDFFTCTVFLSWLGIEMMSLVNPGVFCPLPYLLMVTFSFVVLEKYGGDKVKPLRLKRAAHKKGMPV